MPSLEPTLPPIIYSSPADDVIERRRPAEQFNAQNERNVYDLVMTGIAEPGLKPVWAKWQRLVTFLQYRKTTQLVLFLRLLKKKALR